jgi:hypothetical protein
MCFGTMRSFASQRSTFLEPEMKRELHIQLNEPRAQALVRGFTPCANGWLEDRRVSGKVTMA